MNINLARKLDYFLGISICFFLSIVHNLLKIIEIKKSEKIIPKKIMFLEFTEMGSAILSYSAMKKAKEVYLGALLYFWIFKKNQDSVHLLNIIPKENVITMRDDKFLFLLFDALRNLWRIRKERIDAVLDMELFSRFSSILGYLTGAKIRVGFHRFSSEGLYRGNLFTHRVNYNPYMHISKNFLGLVESLGASFKDAPLLKMSLINCKTTVPRIKSTEDEEENLWQKLRRVNGQICKRNKIVVLNPGINEVLPLRRWPIENYVELAKKLLVDPEVFVVLIGLGPNFSDGKKICQEISNSHLINVIGKTNIREIITLYNISHLLISHDSGATNLASLTEVNIIVLFGPETPLLYAPLSSNKTVFYSNLACSPCFTAYNHRYSVCKDNRCLKEIAVEQVYNTAKIYLYKIKDDLGDQKGINEKERTC